MTDIDEAAAPKSNKEDGRPELHIDRKFQGKEAILSSQISLFVEETKPNIPDGGWGWFVVFAGFMLNVISEGVTLSFGLLYIEFLAEFKASKSATSWIGSLFMAVPLLVGPVASALVDKYGCKYMTVAGGIITALAFVFSAFANSIGVMYVTFGILGGVGRGVTYVTCVVPMAFWFEKKRSAALGIAASGAGFGTIIFAPFTTFLIGQYGWRGTLLILAGCFLNMCVCGMLMRDPEWMIEEERREKRANKASKNKSNPVALEDLEASLTKEEEAQALLQHDGTLVNKSRSVDNLPTYLKEMSPQSNKELDSFMKDNARNVTANNSALDKDHGSSKIEASVISTVSRLNSPGNLVLSRINEEDEPRNADVIIAPLPEISVDAKPKINNRAHGYLEHLKYRRSSIGHTEVMMQKKLRSSSCPDVYRNLTPTDEQEQKWYKEIVHMFKFLMHFSLYLELHFLLLTVATINLFIWFIVPYFYLAEHMTRIGYTETQASFVLSVIGFTNTVGMVVLGWVGDRLSIAKTYAVCLILCGISILAMMYFTTSYMLLVINCGLFGLFFASCFSLAPSLLSQLVPLDEFTLAYGLGLLNEGIGNLIGPPLAGLLFDITKSWEQSFYQAGIWIIISGILIGVIPYTKNRRLIGSKRLRNDQATSKSNNTHNVHLP